MAITIKEIEHLGKLSKLRFTEEEKKGFLLDMDNILNFANKLSELDVSDVEPTMHVANIHNVFRDDVVKPSYDTALILKNAPESDMGCFVVPKTVEG